jgi:hypothetical protein
MCFVYRHFEPGERTSSNPVFSNALIEDLFDLLGVIHGRIMTAMPYGFEIDLKVLDELIVNFLKVDIIKRILLSEEL